MPTPSLLIIPDLLNMPAQAQSGSMTRPPLPSGLPLVLWGGVILLDWSFQGDLPTCLGRGSSFWTGPSRVTCLPVWGGGHPSGLVLPWSPTYLLGRGSPTDLAGGRTGSGGFTDTSGNLTFPRTTYVVGNNSYNPFTLRAWDIANTTTSGDAQTTHAWINSLRQFLIHNEPSVTL